MVTLFVIGFYLFEIFFYQMSFRSVPNYKNKLEDWKTSQELILSIQEI